MGEDGSKTFVFLSATAHRALDPSAPKASGGAELQVALLSVELAGRGHRVVIAASSGDFSDGVEWQGVRIRNAGPYESGTLSASWKALRPLVNVLRQEKPDYVVVYGWTSWLTILCYLRPFLKFRVVFVCALDGEINGRFRKANPIRGRIFARGLKAADHRFAITSEQAGQFHRQGMTCLVTRLLLQPVAESRAPAKDIDVLWVARCHPVKRPGLFLDFVEKHPGVSARMICSPQDAGLFARVRERARALPNLEFLEGVSYREIQSHFDGAKIFVNTSEDEGVPNTFLHSGLAGTVIVSLVSDPDGMLAKFGAGFSAKGNVPEMEKAIMDLLANPAALGAAAAGARSFISAWHDNERNVQQFLKGLGL